ncbi:MAG: sensor domain-containing diguanylate cyclase [Treponema sp.]|jgi:diguanylate cyclase (GGDEF)-like protein|nr:sensor domain-containing diguanylate cyclase [Treponema sp.]
MNEQDNPIQNSDDFLSAPKIAENYSLLRQIGVFSHIDALNNEIRAYKNLLSGALDIFNHTSIDEIMDATVHQISDHFLPSFIAFLWKPIQNRDEITIKGYQNYQLADLGFKIHSIAPFEPFFRQFPQPINYDVFACELKDKEALRPFKKMKPEIVVPILGPFGLYGIILMGRKLLAGSYSEKELLFIEQLLAFVSQAIKNHLHYEHSLRDTKTGLFNHGFFVYRLNEEIARTKRGKYPSSVIVMDVDKFKKFNDSYGHLVGDKVLETLALTIKKNVRNEDIPSRFGGEEFTVLLPNSGQDVSWVVSERLRKAVAAMSVPWEPSLPQVTISLGIYTFDKDNTLDAEGIILRADEALYLSKERGRNRSTIWSSEGICRRENKTETG